MFRIKKSPKNNPIILILEDDPDQMDLLADFALGEIQKLMDDERLDDEKRQKIDSIKVIKANNIKDLQAASTMHTRAIFALLDCNTPDSKGKASHDQLVKTNHSITGQHRAVDIVTEHLPDTPITIISAMDRFQRIVNKYYASKHSLTIHFVRKNDPVGIQRHFQYYLNEYLDAADWF